MLQNIVTLCIHFPYFVVHQVLNISSGSLFTFFIFDVRMVHVLTTFLVVVLLSFLTYYF